MPELDNGRRKLPVDAAERDTTVFWNLWMQFKDDLYRICINILGKCAADAEDALSTAMLTACEKYPQNRCKIYNFKGWLIRLTQNICIDIVRKRNRVVNCEDSIGEEFRLNKWDDLQPYYFESLEDTLFREKILLLVCKSIKKLPAHLQETAVLFFILRMSYQDIAHHFNLSTANIRKRIQQARGTLTRDLEFIADDLNFLSRRNGCYLTTPAWFEAVEEAEAILKRDFREIDGFCMVSNMVQLLTACGLEKSIRFFLKAGLCRQETRIRTLQEYVKCYPGGWKKQLELAELLYAKGDWNQAITAFRLTLEKHPQSLDASIRLGDMLRDIGRKEESMKVLMNALSYTRKESSKFHIRGMIELCRSRVDRALTEFSSAATLDKGNEAHQQRLAMTNLLADRPIQALKAFDRVLEINPNDLYSLTYSYECLVLTGRLDMAALYTERALRIYPDDIVAVKRKVDSRCFKGMTCGDEGKKTRILLRRLKKLAPQTADVLESQAIYYYSRGDYKKCLELLEQGCREKPDSPEHMHYFACWLFRTGFYRAAAGMILKTVQIYKESPLFWRTACEIFIQAGKNKELEITTGEMLERFPDHWSVCATAGLALINLGDNTRRAIETSRQAILLQPRLPEAYFMHGRVLSLTGDIDGAIENLLLGWELLPGDDSGLQSTPAALLLARTYRELGRKHSCRKWFAEVSRRAEKLKDYLPAQAYYWLGKALHELVAVPTAARALRRAVELRLFYPARHDAKSILKGYTHRITKMKFDSKDFHLDSRFVCNYISKIRLGRD